MQWGQPIGKHEAIAQKIAHMASHTFAMEAVAELSTALYEQGGYDIRLEAAIAKMYNTEAGWRIVDDALQIRGGRGYETAQSLEQRGEKPIPVERAMRDFRINLIFEGSSEIMRLFIAREAVDHHFKLAFPIVAPESTMQQRLGALSKSAPFYATWYPARWLAPLLPRTYGDFGSLASHLRFANRATNKLGRAIFHAMVRFGPKLERRQMILFRAVDIGAELYAMAAACSRAHMLAKQGRTGGRRARGRVLYRSETTYSGELPRVVRAFGPGALQGCHAGAARRARVAGAGNRWPRSARGLGRGGHGRDAYAARNRRSGWGRVWGQSHDSDPRVPIYLTPQPARIACRHARRQQRDPENGVQPRCRGRQSGSNRTSSAR